MISNRLTISPDLSVRSCRDRTIQLKLARNNGLGEITFANEIRHHVNFANRIWIEQEQGVTQARLLFPKRALHIRKNFLTSDLRRVRQSWRARVQIHRGAVSDDQ